MYEFSTPRLLQSQLLLVLLAKGAPERCALHPPGLYSEYELRKQSLVAATNYEQEMHIIVTTLKC